MSPTNIPAFSELPIDKSGPRLNAWGLYGKSDELGTLNRLTPEVVKAAASEIQTGIRIGLDWPLDAQGDLPFFGRQEFHKKIIHKAPRVVNDDVWTFNTQSSTQWDGLRHFAYQKEARFYNGVTLDDIHGEHKSNVNGIGAWAAQGIVGRGVLLDYHGWRAATKPEVKVDKFHAFTTGSISIADLKSVAEWQGTELHFGDVLFVRSGYMHAHQQMTRDELLSLRQKTPTGFLGVEQSEETLQWVWEHFSAVAGDHPSFECWPTQKEWSCHEVFLSGWGMPIGELFDLEKLAEHCAKVKRYSFFLTSEPCNVPGGVASPPNALAIF
ncbi:hypothetical protein K461DRAFT_327623 [Myriangium duriaei CBS 260.36]|uniref:Cyclase n=1 Tax=Myriangium duriaei CBS 260.36 TaxID=1168546 RepID=A0A9P4J0H5_9PEZI|nr:hypothetical protein K461DRAFT_327623 [Myriangium duriaei CBS 260.36]